MGIIIITLYLTRAMWAEAAHVEHWQGRLFERPPCGLPSHGVPEWVD